MIDKFWKNGNCELWPKKVITQIFQRPYIFISILGSVDIAIKKAKTAIFFNMPTGEIGKLSQPGKPLYNIEHSNGGLITFPGGVPIQNGQNVLIGGIGVSGSTVENDHQVASAGLNAVMG